MGRPTGDQLVARGDAFSVRGNGAKHQGQLRCTRLAQLCGRDLVHNDPALGPRPAHFPATPSQAALPFVRANPQHPCARAISYGINGRNTRTR